MKMYASVLFLMFLIPFTAFAQENKKLVYDEIFHEIELSYIYVNNDKWRGATSANWKHIYDKIGWRRWGGSAYISRKLKFVSFEAGLTATYTFDKDITNYLEARPWLGVRSDLSLSNRLALLQKFVIESRTFLYEDYYSNEHRIRNRFLLSLQYKLLKNRDDWKLNLSGEWYFVQKNADAERFSNSVEYGIKVIKVLSNEHEIALGYKRESYKSAFISDKKHGHLFSLEYSF